MLGKLLGAFAGAEAARHSAAVGGTGGAVLGALAVPLVSRLSIPGLIVLGAGGYLAKRYYDKRHPAGPSEREQAQKAARKARRQQAAATA